MRRWNALLIAWLVTIALSSGSRGQDADAARSLTSRQKWARFAIVRGRVSVFVTRGQGGAAWTEDRPSGESESFGICCESGVVKIRFERRTDDETILMQFLGARELVLTRMPNTKGVVPLHFVQPPSGDVRLTIGSGPSARTISAPTVWHLLMIERELCARELLPVFNLLRTDWRLEQQLEQLDKRLAQATPSAPPADWQKLIQQLGDQRFQVRQAADQELRRFGQSILPSLASVDTSKLDREQRTRIASICEELAESEEDEPQRLAQWLGNDRRLWESLVASQNPDWVAIAQQKISLLDGAPQQQGKLAESR